MITYNNILVPYDNSKLSDTAFDHAMTIAVSDSFELSYGTSILLYVIIYYCHEYIYIIT